MVFFTLECIGFNIICMHVGIFRGKIMWNITFNIHGSFVSSQWSDRSDHKTIPANSHALGVSLTPASWKLRSHAGSRLRANFSRLIEKCELLPSCLTQFPKYVNSDPCIKEQKPCVTWINDNTFLTISDFWSEKHWERARLQQTSDVFGRLRTSSDFFRNLRKWPCRLQKSQHSQDKNLTLISQKKLAGIYIRPVRRWHWLCFVTCRLGQVHQRTV